MSDKQMLIWDILAAWTMLDVERVRFSAHGVSGPDRVNGIEHSVTWDALLLAYECGEGYEYIKNFSATLRRDKPVTSEGDRDARIVMCRMYQK